MNILCRSKIFCLVDSIKQILSSLFILHMYSSPFVPDQRVFMDQTNYTRPYSFDNMYIICSAKNNISQCLMNSSTQNVSITSVNKETYWERYLGFLIIGIIGILANVVVIIILGTSVKIRRKLVNTLIIHQSFVDFLASVALVGTAHFSGYDPHGLEGIHAKIYWVFLSWAIGHYGYQYLLQVLV